MGEMSFSVVGKVAIATIDNPPVNARALDSWIVKVKPQGMAGNLKEMLDGMGRDAHAILSSVEAPEMEAKLAASADEARELGLFGSPHFVVHGEVFWGDDRLEDAVSWAKFGRGVRH